MKTVFTITVIFIILTVAGIGCAVILGIMTTDEATTLLTKALAIFILLGACSALIAKLSGLNKADND